MMLQKVKLQNFKCFPALDLPCAPLTILCGLNGMGKSSIIQSLLVLRQSIDANYLDFPRELLLNGDLAHLGTGIDVFTEDVPEDEGIGIEIWDTEFSKPFSLEYRFVSDADRLPIVATQTFDAIEAAQYSKVLSDREFFHIGAERLGPRTLYPFSRTITQGRDLGAQSELALSYWHALSRRDTKFSADDPRNVSGTIPTKTEVLDYWLGTISPGTHLELRDIPEADSILARFSFKRSGDIPTRPFRATNVGFGLSYTLPVIIALLSQANTLCLIENPEAHLHPKGQTTLAELCVRASISGLQLIIETHSDHFLDGIRIAARKGLISPDNVAIHYFERQGGNAEISSPVLDADGRLSHWPDGFFDQHEENLSKLLAPLNTKT